MKRFADQKIGDKLAFAFSLVIGLGLVGYFNTVRAMQSYVQNSSRVQQIINDSIFAAKDVAISSHDMASYTDAYVYSGDQTAFELTWVANESEKNAFTELQSRVNRLPNNTALAAAGGLVLDRYRIALSWEDKAQRLTMADRGRHGRLMLQAQGIYQAEIVPARDRMEISIDQTLIPQLENYRRQAQKSEIDSAHNAITLGWIAQGSLVLFSSLIGLFMSRHIGKTLSQLEQAKQQIQRSGQHLVNAQRIAHVGDWHLDMRTNAATWSDELFHVLGLEPGTVKPSHKAFLRCLHPADYALVVETVRTAQQRREEFSLYHRIVRGDGDVRWLQVHGEFGFDADGRPVAMVGTAQDVTERKRSEEALHDSEERYRRLVESSPEVIAVHSEGNIVYINAAGVILFGAATAEELIGRRLLDLIHPDYHAIVAQRVRQIEQEGLKTSLLHEKFIRLDGSVVDVEVVGIPTFYRGKSATQIVVRDITERKAFEEELAYQAFHDALTGLPNRVLLTDRMKQALVRAEQRSDSVAVLYLDLDNFKVINDSLGHPAGDALLTAVAERLTACVPAMDTVARIGGDEFAVLLEHIAGKADVVAAAERIAARLAEPVRLGEREMFVTASVGIALGNGRRSPEDLLRDADVAMYHAKGGGKAGYAVFHDSMAALVMERMEMESELRRALERGEFRLHYQPIVSLKTRALVEVEALVRWEHPQRGLVPPGKFIPIAEETGLIVPLGQWVLEEACRQAKEWQSRYPVDPPLVISVNLSARQLQQPDLVLDAARILRESSLLPSTLKLEITESVMMEDAEATIEKLRGLRALGVRLAVDDFGTGYSSMAYLSRFPIDTLKIDRAFVQKIGDADGFAIIRAIVNLARALNLSVTSEGIETEEQWDYLALLGCERGQGYLLSPPLPASRIGPMLTPAEFGGTLVERAA